MEEWELDRSSDTGPDDARSLGDVESLEGHVVAVQALRGADSPRLAGENDEHSRMLAESGAALPPILVHRATMRVIDGMHRLRAAQLRGEQTVAVRFFEGDVDDAFVAAVRANIAHGLPLTLSDREAAAARILATHGRYSDRSIARITGLSAKTVGDIRRQGNGESATSRIGRDGRVRPVSSSEGRRLASQAMADRPEASLREIARSVGMSPTTVRDVRERMRRGEDPVPEGRPRSMRSTRAGGSARSVRPGMAASGPRNSHDGAADRDAGPTRASLLETLSKDPSLRFSESGRALLRVLFTRSSGPPDPALLESVPPHCAFTVAALARACAQEWLSFAGELERHVGE
jgi:ParB-like nuclease domain